jgi:glutathionylspermidine amidase/synthetase
MQGSQKNELVVAPFGTVLGVTDGGVEVCSCDYKSADSSKFPTRDSYQMYHNGVYTGFRYQCVELARRYLLTNYGVIFDSIPMAYDIFNLKHVKRVKDDKLFVMTAHPNESKIKPHKGSLMIWDPHGEFKVTGHVAVVVEVGDDYVEIAEQNVDDALWPKGQKCSRRLKARTDEQSGNFYVMCTFGDSHVLGWMNLHLDQEYHPEELKVCKKDDLKKVIFEIPETVAEKKWLDLDNPAIALFAKLHGEGLVEKGSKTGTFFSLSETSHNGLAQATEELHKMFMHATEAVIHNEEMLSNNFHFPKQLWSKLRRSWYTRHRDIIAGRFDFGLSSTGVKV